MSDILERLDRWTRLRLDAEVPINGWHRLLQDDLLDTIAEIKRLRSLAGSVSIVPTASDIYRDLRHKAPQGHQSDTDHGG